jgi:hypothetical protein
MTEGNNKYKELAVDCKIKITLHKNNSDYYINHPIPLNIFLATNKQDYD